MNDVKGDSRFDHKTIALDKQLASMAIGDFNGDGRTDIACLGVPDRLIIYFQPASSGEWSDHTTVRVPDVAPLQWNHGGRRPERRRQGRPGHSGPAADVRLPAAAQRRPATPTTLMNTSEKLTLAQVADLDGDGRKDLCYVAGEAQDRICHRLQDKAGRLGPELQFDVDQHRVPSRTPNSPKAPPARCCTIDRQTGRLRFCSSRLPGQRSDEPAGRLVRPALDGRIPTAAAICALGDVDGDGLPILSLPIRTERA